MAAHSLGKGVLLKPDPIADAFRDEVKTALAQCTRPPTLIGILGTTSAPSQFYADFTRKQCEQLGVRFILKKVGSAESPERGDGEGVEEVIIEANEDPDIDGIMVSFYPTLCFSFILMGAKVYYPIFGGGQVCDCSPVPFPAHNSVAGPLFTAGT